jgi:uncharacterized protein (TIGR03437 family)
VTGATPPIVRAEGLAERIGDITFLCTGAPNGQMTGNFTFLLNTDVTNRISMGSTLTGLVFTVDNGSGPQSVTVQPLLQNQSTLVFNGVPVTFSAQGTAKLNVAGIRANATLIGVGNAITAFISVNAAGFPIATAQLVVARPEVGLYVGMSTELVCAQNGSPLPSNISFTNLLSDGTAFASTRITEGFADAFGPKSAFDYFNADSGQRIIVEYSGFPAGASLFVPDVIAGSDAIHPTAGGDFEVAASGGAYTPSANGSLLLSRVAGAGSNGAGGSPIYIPGAIGSGTVTFDNVTQIPLTNGSAYVVYEVVDANASAVETAQFPTFLGLTPDGSRPASQTSESVFFAPLSTVGTASATEPLPRFIATTPPPDCTIIGDCSFVQGSLAVDTTPLEFSEPAGGVTGQSYFTIANTGGGMMNWTASVSYISGSGWLTLDPPQGANNTTVRVYASPATLAAGTYQASIQVNAGAAGTATVLVSFVVTPGSTTSKIVPAITSVLNAASFAAVPVVPGSLTTIMGSAFTGKLVSVTFNGEASAILFSNDAQINLMVPADLPLSSPAQMVVTVDGSSSAAMSVPVAAFEPAIFPGALLNQDATLNSASNGAKPGSVIYFWATGLSGNGAISVLIGNREIDAPYYAGPAPGLPGVQQVNLVVPADLPAMTTDLYVCGLSSAAGATKTCSVPVPVTLQ